MNNQSFRPGVFHRHAFTLAELIVAMTTSAVLFMLAIGVVERVMKLSTDAGARAEHQASLARLGSQLRNDVHAAKEVDVTTDDSGLRLTLKDSQNQTILYTVSGAVVTRESDAEGSAAKVRETYRLAKASRVRIETEEGQKVITTIARVTPEGEVLESRVAARVGRWPSPNLQATEGK